jgi:hypothetical protein
MRLGFPASLFVLLRQECLQVLSKGLAHAMFAAAWAGNEETGSRRER